MHDAFIMQTISDPKDKVYYIEDLTVDAEGAIDPMHPFRFWSEANDYARDVMKLQVEQYKIIEWQVD